MIVWQLEAEEGKEGRAHPGQGLEIGQMQIATVGSRGVFSSNALGVVNNPAIPHNYKLVHGSSTPSKNSESQTIT
ncbi:hypothetical protein CsSME_00009291 [Camellia sinensis var. sinensis]